MTKGEAWRKWWHEKHGKNMPMGGYHPMEGNMYDAFTAGWEAHAKLPAVPSTTGHDVIERPWVGLTPEEVKEISFANRPYVVDMVVALEAKLKEKNT